LGQLLLTVVVVADLMKVVTMHYCLEQVVDQAVAQNGTALHKAVEQALLVKDQLVELLTTPAVEVVAALVGSANLHIQIMAEMVAQVWLMLSAEQ
jgi:hypothetical protein